MLKHKINLLLLISFFFIVNTYSQVTIGSNEKPVDGALLQLKNIDNITDSSMNSTKGLLLPRVKLTDIESLTDISGGSGEEINLIGLSIYNTNTFCQNEKMHYEGMYVWDGEQWVNLSNSKQGASADVWITKDQDNNTFRASMFGNHIWMIDNLAVKTYASESNSKVTLPTAPNGLATYTNVSLGYTCPNPAPNPLPSGSTGATDGTDQYYYNNFREYGILYTWMAATAGNSSVFNTTDPYVKIDQQCSTLSSISDNEVEKKESLGYIQGICPNGWHLPSDREWFLLMKEIFENPQNYSQITEQQQQAWVPNKWSDLNLSLPNTSINMFIAVNTGINAEESNLALAMKRPCELAFSNTSTLRNGKANLVIDGGFNVMPVGSIYGTTAVGYGDFSRFWTSSMGRYDYSDDQIKAISRGFNFTNNSQPINNSVIKEISNTFDYNSVRCVYHGDLDSSMPDSWKDKFVKWNKNN